MSGSAIVIGVGAPAGLGAALCRRFAGEGLQVFAAGRTEQKLERVADEIARGRPSPPSRRPRRRCGPWPTAWPGSSVHRASK